MIEPIKQFNNLESEKPENFRERERERVNRNRRTAKNH